MSAGLPEVGAVVRVRDEHPPGHIRTPYYARGRRGVVESIAGDFRNAEDLAYGRPGLPKVRLFRVRFAQRELWPDYAGSPSDTTVIDIYEHWLEEERA